MSTDDVLLGLGLGDRARGRLAAAGRRLRLPAIVVLLPVGFLAGIATDDVHPDVLLGALYQPFVSLAVGLILFEAGLRLSVAGDRERRTPDGRPARHRRGARDVGRRLGRDGPALR